MGKDVIGRLMTTAPNNIRYERELTNEERTSAEILAPFFREIRRNWIPIFVREIKKYHYQLIGNPIIVEAVKIAGLDEIYIIEIDDNPLIEQQILKYEELLLKQNRGVSAFPSLDLTPLLIRIENIETGLNQQKEMLEKIVPHVTPAVPDNTLFINYDEGYLKKKLAQVSGIGKGKTLKKIIKEITEFQPFNSEIDLKELISLFKTKAGKDTKIFTNLKQMYALDFSIKE